MKLFFYRVLRLLLNLLFTRRLNLIDLLIVGTVLLGALHWSWIILLVIINPFLTQVVEIALEKAERKRGQ